MATPFYLIAHHALPTQAASDPAGLWAALSGPDWSTWLAMVGQKLGESVRGVGVEGVLTGAAVQRQDGIEMIALYFPTPSGPGEPFYAVLARPAGSGEVRSFVFELGVPEPGGPQRVVMAEWRILKDNKLGDKGSKMRVRFDVEDDASLSACLRRTAAIMKEAAASPGPSGPQAASMAQPMSAPAAARSGGMSAGLVVLLAVGAVIALGAVLIYVLMNM